MEANVYRFYTQKCKGIIIEYEPEIFYYPTKGDLVLNAHTYKASYFNPLQIKGYCPDFKITYGHFTWYVEVKGKMDRLSIEKARLFKKFYPHLKLYFITPKEYNLIKYFYSKSIRGWE